MSQAGGQDEPYEAPDEPSSSQPESISEIVDRIMAQINQIIAILEGQAARRG
jgi:hypothetical protein